ncbi:MAG TPA: hypothetical protein VFT31_13370 [Kribbella sp.]|nr:hypothetical protein [Kribbella sp.]
MPEPENEPEQELGPRVSDALQAKADAARPVRGESLAREARRRVRKRRQALTAGAAAVVVAVVIGGVWSSAGGPAPVATSSNDSAAAGAGDAKESAKAPTAPDTCPAQHPITQAPSHDAVPPGVGLDLSTPVNGLQACRYRILGPGQSGKPLLGSASFSAATAQAVVKAISSLPERNPDLPVFKCMPAEAKPDEAIVLRFGTAAGVREVWVGYDGCSSAGFFTGERTYGLYAAPLKLFMTGSVRPSGGTYLDHLRGW